MQSTVGYHARALETRLLRRYLWALRRAIPKPSSRAALQTEAQRLRLELIPQIRPVVSGVVSRAPRNLLGPAKKAVVIGAALALAVLAEGVLRRIRA